MGEIWNEFIKKTKEFDIDLLEFDLRSILKLFWAYDHKGENGLKDYHLRMTCDCDCNCE
jgi:hypothetical protein